MVVRIVSALSMIWISQLDGFQSLDGQYGRTAVGHVLNSGKFSVYQDHQQAARRVIRLGLKYGNCANNQRQKRKKNDDAAMKEAGDQNVTQRKGLTLAPGFASHPANRHPALRR